jgi:hypothetical protein
MIAFVVFADRPQRSQSLCHHRPSSVEWRRRLATYQHCSTRGKGVCSQGMMMIFLDLKMTNRQAGTSISGRGIRGAQVCVGGSPLACGGAFAYPRSLLIFRKIPAHRLTYRSVEFPPYLYGERGQVLIRRGLEVSLFRDPVILAAFVHLA